MARGITVLEVKRVSFQKDMVQRGMHGTIETKKQEDGSFVASMLNQNVSAKGRDEEEAVVNLKKVYKDNMTQGQFGDKPKNDK